MEGGGYFRQAPGHPGEDDTDAANDLTFGDLGDVKAGDDLSESLWKPDHRNLSVAIEAEKERYRNHGPSQFPLETGNLTRTSSVPSDTTRHSIDPERQQPVTSTSFVAPSSGSGRMASQSAKLDLGSALPSLPHALASAKQVPRNETPRSKHDVDDSAVLSELARTSGISENVSNSDSSVLPEIPKFFSPNSAIRAITSEPNTQPTRNSTVNSNTALASLTQETPPQHQQAVGNSAPSISPYRLTQHNLSQQIPAGPPHFSNGQSLPHPAVGARLSPEEYERNVIHMYEQQTRDLLVRQQETAAHQLQEALAAQQAGAIFDRAKFDTHQSTTRQLIITEYYAKVRQLKLQVWQHKQQQQQLQPHQQQYHHNHQQGQQHQQHQGHQNQPPIQHVSQHPDLSNQSQQHLGQGHTLHQSRFPQELQGQYEHHVKLIEQQERKHQDPHEPLGPDTPHEPNSAKQGQLQPQPVELQYDEGNHLNEANDQLRYDRRPQRQQHPLFEDPPDQRDVVNRQKFAPAEALPTFQNLSRNQQDISGHFNKPQCVEGLKNAPLHKHDIRLHHGERILDGGKQKNALDKLGKHNDQPSLQGKQNYSQMGSQDSNGSSLVPGDFHPHGKGHERTIRSEASPQVLEELESSHSHAVRNGTPSNEASHQVSMSAELRDPRSVSSDLRAITGVDTMRHDTKPSSLQSIAVDTPGMRSTMKAESSNQNENENSLTANGGDNSMNVEDTPKLRGIYSPSSSLEKCEDRARHELIPLRSQTREIDGIMLTERMSSFMGPNDSGGDNLSNSNDRLREVERQMADIGLTPSKSPPEDNTPTQSKSPRDSTRNSLLRSDRRLESMTDRDQELVFRVHLRQLESSVVYKDDYYNAVMKGKEKSQAANVFGDLAGTVRTIRNRTRERGREGTGGRARRSRQHLDQSASPPNPHHHEHKIKALANALGTVQTWNPRAPRRVMDFAKLDRDGGFTKSSPKTLLRDDVGVHVRLEIEKGYDLIAGIHDICRGESTESIEAQIHSLLQTLHLEDRQDEPMLANDVSPRSSQFFASLVVTGKGRRYLETVAELLDSSERVRLTLGLVENLGAMIFVLRKTGNVEESGLLRMMVDLIQSPDITGEDALSVMESFITSHVSHRDAMLTTFQAAAGSTLVFTVMQRILRADFKAELDDEELHRSNVGQLAVALMDCLPEICASAESLKRVWDVVASLDGLLGDHAKRRYRRDLSHLLRNGTIPEPPEF